MNIEYRQIQGLDGYLVSNKGDVISLNYKNTGTKKALKPQERNGYLLVNIKVDGTRHTFLVHRLVAQAFIPNPNNLPQVNHKDENKANNSVSNLEWCSAKYNANYGTRNEKVSKAQDCTKTPIMQYDKNMNYINTFESIHEAASELDLKVSNIWSVLNNKNRMKSTGGFVFKYAVR